jgi:hypothetical protein
VTTTDFGSDNIGKEYIFLCKAIFFGLAAILIIPKHELKKYFVYGLFFGALGDIFLILSIGTLLHQFRYLNMGTYSVFGLWSFWTPIAWMFTLMVFFYCLPPRKIFFYPYIFIFGMFGYMVGTVLENFGLFEYIGIYRYIAPLVLTGWFALSAWGYLKLERFGLR